MFTSTGIKNTILFLLLVFLLHALLRRYLSTTTTMKHRASPPGPLHVVPGAGRRRSPVMYDDYVDDNNNKDNTTENLLADFNRITETATDGVQCIREPRNGSRDNVPELRDAGDVYNLSNLLSNNQPSTTAPHAHSIQCSSTSSQVDDDNIMNTHTAVAYTTLNSDPNDDSQLDDDVGSIGSVDLPPDLIEYVKNGD